MQFGNPPSGGGLNWREKVDRKHYRTSSTDMSIEDKRQGRKGLERAVPAPFLPSPFHPHS